jgi:hypothetical protein
MTRCAGTFFGANYGEAGAIDVLGSSYGPPGAYSGHNGFSQWGQHARYALPLGYAGLLDAAPDFTRSARLAVIDDGVGLDNDEQHVPVLLCEPATSWKALWPRLIHYD